MLSSRAVAVADAYWAAFFGCRTEELRPAAARVGGHVGIGPDYPGVYLMELGAAPVVSVPPTVAAPALERVAAWCAGVVRDPAAASAALGWEGATVVGPAYVGYAERAGAGDSIPGPGRGDGATRVLGAGAENAVAALRESCDPTEWAHGGSELGEAEQVVGSFSAEGALAAVAGYERWGGTIAHISVVTHPAWRGRGHAARAVASLVRLVLERGLLPQYRTLESNAASVAVARRLGFTQYAASLALRPA